jgi:hypothetical protein
MTSGTFEHFLVTCRLDVNSIALTERGNLQTESIENNEPIDECFNDDSDLN